MSPCPLNLYDKADERRHKQEREKKKPTAFSMAGSVCSCYKPHGSARRNESSDLRFVLSGPPLKAVPGFQITCARRSLEQDQVVSSACGTWEEKPASCSIACNKAKLLRCEASSTSRNGDGLAERVCDRAPIVPSVELIKKNRKADALKEAKFWRLAA